MTRIAVTFLISIFSFAFGYGTIPVNEDFLDINVSQFSDYLNTNDQLYSVGQIADPVLAKRFTPVHRESLNFNDMPGETWLTFAVSNPSGQTQHLYLIAETPFLNSAELFFQNPYQGNYDSVITGQNLSLSSRPYQLSGQVIPFDVRSGYQQLFLKIQPLHATDVQFRLVDELSLIKQSRQELLISSMVTCTISLFIILSLTNYFQYRSNLSLWLALIQLGVLINIAGWNGSISGLISFVPYIEISAANLGAFLTLYGLSRLIRLAKEEQRNNWAFRVLRLLSILLLVVVVLTATPLSKSLLPLQVLLAPVVWTVMGLLLFEKPGRNRSERLMLAGHGLLALYYAGITLGLLSIFSMIGANALVMQSIVITGVVLLSLGGWLKAKQGDTRLSPDKPNFSNAYWPILRKLNHDLRGPINGVLGMTELMQDTALSAYQQEYVNTIQSAGFSLLREADQLQNLIRIGLNQVPSSEEEFDLYDLIEDTVQPYSKIAHSKKIELVVDIDPKLPSRYRSNTRVVAQILSIVLDNALKYTEQGEVLVQVKPWQGQRIRFSITDTGPGMAKDTQARLFSFPDGRSRNHLSPKEVHLGLPVCKHLVNLLGGQISVNSELRMGTTFFIDLPLHSTLRKGFSRTAANEHALEGYRLMVVDDNMTCRKVIEHLANSWGMTVSEMSNGQSALANLHYEYHKHQPIDVLVLDQNMPSMSGIELAHRVRQDPEMNRDIVIIMMSGADTISIEMEEEEPGIEAILSKPISARALKQALQEALPIMQKNRTANEARNKQSYFF